MSSFLDEEAEESENEDEIDPNEVSLTCLLCINHFWSGFRTWDT